MSGECPRWARSRSASVGPARNWSLFLLTQHYGAGGVLVRPAPSGRSAFTRFFGGGSPFAAFSAAYASLARRRCTIHGLLSAPVLVCGIYIYAPRVCAGNPGWPQFELRLSPARRPMAWHPKKTFWNFGHFGDGRIPDPRVFSLKSKSKIN